MIVVHKPEIKENGNLSRVEYLIEEDQEKKLLYFEFEHQYIDGLTVDRGDGLLTMLFFYAMKRKHNLKFDMPISERLYYQITTYLIDGLHAENPKYEQIEVDAELTGEDYKKHNNRVVGTGMSLGTDSLCTFYTHNYKNKEIDGYKVNLFCFFNVGAFHYGDGRKYKEQNGKSVYEEHKKLVQQFADEVKIPLFVLSSNFAELFPEDHDMVDAMRNCGLVLMFQKMFDVYYYSSAYPINDFHLDPEKGSEYYEIFTLPNLSTNSVTFYSSNSTYDKLRKTIEISKFNLAHKYLNVCTVGIENCGQCAKCTRTMMMIDAANAIDDFSDVFNVSNYKKRKGMLMGYALASRKETHFKELVPVLKKEKKIPFASYFYYIIFAVAKPIEKAMRKLPAEKRRSLVEFSERHHIRVPF